MAMTKVKGDMHYCPNCGASADTSLQPFDIDVKQREIGQRYGYPYYGIRIKCKKCEWTGEWYIPPKDYKKLNDEHQKYINSNKTHFKRSEFRR
jgi:hypothetical protein